MNSNGGHVTRAELGAHLRRLDERLGSIDRSLGRIEVRLDARPATRWLAGRATQVVDRALPLGVIFAVGYLTASYL